jgi:CheY-like chemotaxis protein
MAEETHSLTGLSLLVLEDDQDNLELLATYLNYCGAAVVASRSANAGLEYLNGHRFDLIMTDLTVLQSMGAAKFLQDVRALPDCALTPIIAVSGWIKQHGGDADPDFTERLLKPVDLDSLRQTILRLVGENLTST